MNAPATPRNDTITGSRYLAETLAAYGLDHVFFMDAVLRRTLAELGTVNIRRILGHSEKSVVYMADGYARAGRRVAVVMAQSVGAANLAAGLQDGRFFGSPIIAITGRHVPNNQYRNAYQELPHEPMYQSFVKASYRIDTPEQLPRTIRQVFREASSGVPRPVHLDVSGNTGMVTDFCELVMDAAVEPEYARIPPQRPAADPGQVAKAAQAIAKAKRPVIIAGAGAMMSGAEAAIRALAEKADIAVVASLDAKAVLVDDHRLFAGIVGTYSCHCANKLVAEADLAIFIGSDAGDQVTNNYTLPRPGAAVVQIDMDASELGRNFGGAIGLHADPRTAVEQIAAQVSATQRPEWVARLKELVAEWKAYIAPNYNSNASPIRPERICKELGEWLPSNALVVADTGYASQWTGTMLPLKHSGQSYLRAAGSLGWAYPASLGAKCACPDRPVICFTGDGGFLYHLTELETARRWKIPTITIVNNNFRLAQGLRNLTNSHKGIPGKMEELFAFSPSNFAAIAQAFGCIGIRVEKPEELKPAFERALAANAPVVIDVVSDPDAQADLPWTPQA
ncbi:MAG: thiamine pyrophosphate-binding protein [Variibacter sp.]|nr:thiamine pyrophosphate-binding protein [Variibacter sp.]